MCTTRACGSRSAETMDAQSAFVRHELVAALEPPRLRTGAPAWLHQRLFGSVANAALTIVSLALLVAIVWPTIRFLLIDAVWTGASRDACLPETVGHEVGACWPFVAAKFAQFMYG